MLALTTQYLCRLNAHPVLVVRNQQTPRLFIFINAWKTANRLEEPIVLVIVVNLAHFADEHSTIPEKPVIETRCQADALPGFQSNYSAVGNIGDRRRLEKGTDEFG
jgi:hypothetical protein